MCPMHKHLSAWLESIAPQWGQHVLNLRCCKKSRCGYLPWKTDFWTPLVSAKCRVISAFALAGCGGAQWGRQVTCFLTDRAESAPEENSFSVALMKMCHQARTSLYRKASWCDRANSNTPSTSWVRHHLRIFGLSCDKGPPSGGVWGPSASEESWETSQFL